MNARNFFTAEYAFDGTNAIKEENWTPVDIIRKYLDQTFFLCKREKQGETSVSHYALRKVSKQQTIRDTLQKVTHQRSPIFCHCTGQGHG